MKNTANSYYQKTYDFMRDYSARRSETWDSEIEEGSVIAEFRKVDSLSGETKEMLFNDLKESMGFTLDKETHFFVPNVNTVPEEQIKMILNVKNVIVFPYIDGGLMIVPVPDSDNRRYMFGNDYMGKEIKADGATVDYLENSRTCDVVQYAIDSALCAAEARAQERRYKQILGNDTSGLSEAQVYGVASSVFKASSYRDTIFGLV